MKSLNMYGRNYTAVRTYELAVHCLKEDVRVVEQLRQHSRTTESLCHDSHTKQQHSYTATTPEEQGSNKNNKLDINTCVTPRSLIHNTVTQDCTVITHSFPSKLTAKCDPLPCFTHTSHSIKYYTSKQVNLQLNVNAGYRLYISHHNIIMRSSHPL